MAQEKMPEAGAGAGVDIKGGAVPEAASIAGLLAGGRPLCGAGYYRPLAVVSLQDLPDDLRRQLGGFEQVAPEGAAGYLLLVAGRPDVPPSDRASCFAVGYGHGERGVVGDNSELRVLQIKEEDGKMVYQLDATPIPQVPEAIVGGGMFQLRNGFPAWVERSGDLCFDAAAFAHLGKNRAAELGLGALYYDGLVSAGQNAAVPFVETLPGHNRAAEQGALYYDGLVPAPENVMAAGEAFLVTRSFPYAVQVCLDAAVGAMAGDPIALGARAAGADAKRDGGDNLSAVVGIAAASTAVTAVAAGAVGPVMAFGFFMVLLGGVSLAMATVRAP